MGDGVGVGSAAEAAEERAAGPPPDSLKLLISASSSWTGEMSKMREMMAAAASSAAAAARKTSIRSEGTESDRYIQQFPNYVKMMMCFSEPINVKSDFLLLLGVMFWKVFACLPW